MKPTKNSQVSWLISNNHRYITKYWWSALKLWLAVLTSCEGNSCFILKSAQFPEVVKNCDELHYWWKDKSIDHSGLKSTCWNLTVQITARWSVFNLCVRKPGWFLTTFTFVCSSPWQTPIGYSAISYWSKKNWSVADHDTWFRYKNKNDIKAAVSH